MKEIWFNLAGVYVIVRVLIGTYSSVNKFTDLMDEDLFGDELKILQYTFIAGVSVTLLFFVAMLKLLRKKRDFSKAFLVSVIGSALISGALYLALFTVDFTFLVFDYSHTTYLLTFVHYVIVALLYIAYLMIAHKKRGLGVIGPLVTVLILAAVVGGSYLWSNDTFTSSAKESQNIAKNFSFDLYDTNYTNDDIAVWSKKAIDDGLYEYIEIIYRETINGDFNPEVIKSPLVIRVFENKKGFDIDNCGPTFRGQSIVKLKNCSDSGTLFMGETVYEEHEESSRLPDNSFRKDTPYKTLTVKVDGSRIVIQPVGLSQAEAIDVLNSLQKTNYEDIEFLENEETY